MRRWFDTLRQDLVYGVRSFARTPGFVAVALLSLNVHARQARRLQVRSERTRRGRATTGIRRTAEIGRAHV